MQLFPLLHDTPLAELFHTRVPAGEPWAWVLSQRILMDERLARRLLCEPLSPGMADWISRELGRLRQELEHLKKQHPFSDFGCSPPSGAQSAALKVLLEGSPATLQNLYRSHGYGIYAHHTAFMYSNQMQAIEKPDPVRFDDLVGYDRQIHTLRANVERFLLSKPAVPMLLYGARGSGKSTSVKALRTQYADQGLRLVEVLSDGLEQLPALLELLVPLPFRFVLYMDDLAFASDDERFHKLKALLEGAVYERPQNVLSVATSNRRNLIAQHWSDRPEPDASDPASWDTLQDKLALADRFGLVLTFPPFDQTHYLLAVAHILRRELDHATRNAALQFALDGRGFSGRTARHFVQQHER
jgi:predicted AAA+ superfamily ATPase